MATDLDARLRLEAALDAFLVENFPEAIVRVSPLEMGPPIGWPLQYRLSGPDVEVLRTMRCASPRRLPPIPPHVACISTGSSPPAS
jgi:hypothetical protein